MRERAPFAVEDLATGRGDGEVEGFDVGAGAGAGDEASGWLLAKGGSGGEDEANGREGEGPQEAPCDAANG